MRDRKISYSNALHAQSIFPRRFTVSKRRIVARMVLTNNVSVRNNNVNTRGAFRYGRGTGLKSVIATRVCRSLVARSSKRSRLFGSSLTGYRARTILIHPERRTAHVVINWCDNDIVLRVYLSRANTMLYFMATGMELKRRVR